MCVKTYYFQVGGRLRSRIADQLLNELDFDNHQTIVQLEELAIEGGNPLPTTDSLQFT